MSDRPLTEHEAPLVYALDRRSPNDPRFGSVHAVLVVLLAALAVGIVLVL